LNRAVFLDRDGVVNKALVVNGKPHSPSSVEEVEIIPGVAQSVFELKNAGFEVDEKYITERTGIPVTKIISSEPIINDLTE
jgi:histidinol phosphatase-like enzyme